MEYLVAITRQGQLTIPKTLRDAFGIRQATKAARAPGRGQHYGKAGSGFLVARRVAPVWG